MYYKTLYFFGLDFAFAAGVAIRDATMVAPNQPVIQLPYIAHHIAATCAAYGSAGATSNAVSFSITNPTPAITSLSPASARPGSNNLTLTINGANFVPTSQARFGGTLQPTTFVSSSQLRTIIPATLLANEGAINIQVRSPAFPGDIFSNGVSFQVKSKTTLNIGEAQFSAKPRGPGLQSTFVVSWTHPVSWCQLEDVDMRLRAENGAVLHVRLNEEEGEASTISLLDGEGNVTGTGRPGEETVLESPLAYLDLSRSTIVGPPGKLVVMTLAVTFKQGGGGQSLTADTFASDDASEGQGFEPAGSVTVPAVVYLPLILRPTP